MDLVRSILLALAKQKDALAPDPFTIEGHDWRPFNTTFG